MTRYNGVINLPLEQFARRQVIREKWAIFREILDILRNSFIVLVRYETRSSVFLWIGGWLSIQTQHRKIFCSMTDVR